MRILIRRRAIAALAIITVAAVLRFAWHDWDSDHNLHPDERFLGMVAAEVDLPSGLGEYLDGAHSPLNPANRGFGFYVYGDLPLLLVRASGEALERALVATCGDLPPSPTAPASDPALVTCLCWPDGVRRQPTSLDGATRIGRFISALADLATVGWLFLLGRRLWGDDVGVTAAALGAVTVMHIQHAHFATVDALATQFATASLVFAVGAARSGRSLELAATGVAAGLAGACRLNLAPAVGLVPLAAMAFVASGRQGQGGGDGGRRGLVIRTVAGCAAALITFRLAMPYAFAGIVALDPRWVDGVERIRHMLSGADEGGPPGLQWAGRTPLLFALRNMIVWGMGLPLGLAAWAAWGAFLASRFAAIWRTSDQRPPAALDAATILWLWPTLLVGWYGAQRVMSMRYLLPAYPALVVLAAWLLMWPWRTGGTRVARALLPVVLAATAAWAWGFTSVYRHPHTRVEASRWLYDAMPSRASLRATIAGESVEVGVTPLSVEGKAPSVLSFQPQVDMVLESLTLPYVAVTAPDGRVASNWLRLRVGPAPDGRNALVDIAVDAARGGVSVDLEQARVAAGSWTFVVLDPMTPGGSATLTKPVIAGEHWDDQLPLALGGRDPLTSFDLIQLTSFDPDSPAKAAHLVARLAIADAIALSSNRVYAAIPRQPGRWPLTTRFYRLLLEGRLGFEVAAEFTSYPRLGPLVFPDSEGAEVLGLDPDPTRFAGHGGIVVPLPPAEEAFSVYDHPRVVILRKTEAFDRARVAAMLSAEELSSR